MKMSKLCMKIFTDTEKSNLGYNFTTGRKIYFAVCVRDKYI